MTTGIETTETAFFPYNQPFFKQHEFVRPECSDGKSINWLTLIDVELLKALNIIRTEVGHPIMISPAAGSIGRPSGPSGSDHYCNLEEGIFVRAIDVMPYVWILPSLVSSDKRALTREEAHRFGMTAVKWGINAIGIYPGWKPFPGFHLGIREQERLNTWGRVKESYTSFLEALDTLGEV